MFEWVRRNQEARERRYIERQRRAASQWDVVVSFADDTPDYVRRFSGRLSFDSDYDVDGHYLAHSWAANAVRGGVWVKDTLIPPSLITRVKVCDAGSNP